MLIKGEFPSILATQTQLLLSYMFRCCLAGSLAILQKNILVQYEVLFVRILVGVSSVLPPETE